MSTKIGRRKTRNAKLLQTTREADAIERAALRDTVLHTPDRSWSEAAEIAAHSTDLLGKHVITASNDLDGWFDVDTADSLQSAMNLARAWRSDPRLATYTLTIHRGDRARWFEAANLVTFPAPL